MFVSELQIIDCKIIYLTTIRRQNIKFLFFLASLSFAKSIWHNMHICAHRVIYYKSLLPRVSPIFTRNCLCTQVCRAKLFLLNVHNCIKCHCKHLMNSQRQSLSWRVAVFICLLWLSSYSQATRLFLKLGHFLAQQGTNSCHWSKAIKYWSSS